MSSRFLKSQFDDPGHTNASLDTQEITHVPYGIQQSKSATDLAERKKTKQNNTLFKKIVEIQSS